jgi:hypothetical protein
MPLLPPKPKAGTPLVAWLTSLWEFTASLVWSVDADSGLEAEWTRGGWKLRVVQDGLIPAKTSGGITGCVGTTPGEGNVVFELWDGTDLSYETDDTPVLNRWGGSIADGKKCVVYRRARAYWILVWEC